jgi:hypothetical protein
MDIFADDVVSTGIVPTRLMFNTMNGTGGYASRLTIKNDGKTGIGTNTPNSTLQVNGTFAVGTTMGVIGGTSGAPFSLSAANSYIGLSPANGVNNYYQLPDPATCAGRMYNYKEQQQCGNCQTGNGSRVVLFRCQPYRFGRLLVEPSRQSQNGNGGVGRVQLDGGQNGLTLPILRYFFIAGKCEFYKENR